MNARVSQDSRTKVLVTILAVFAVVIAMILHPGIRVALLAPAIVLAIAAVVLFFLIGQEGRAAIVSVLRDAVAVIPASIQYVLYWMKENKEKAEGLLVVMVANLAIAAVATQQVNDGVWPFGWTIAGMVAVLVLELLIPVGVLFYNIYRYYLQEAEEREARERDCGN